VSKFRILHLTRRTELPPLNEEDLRENELKLLVNRMAGPLEQVFHLSSEPSQCTPAAMAVAQYLRNHGYDAHATSGFYTKRNPHVASIYGEGRALISSLHAKMVGLMPVYKRNPQRMEPNLFPSADDELRTLLYFAEDAFVLVDMSSAQGKKRYLVHPTYRQFLPEERQKEVPPIVFDRVDARKLRSQYHLVIASPEKNTTFRKMERVIFNGETPPYDNPEFMQACDYIRGKYQAFNKLMKRETGR